VTEYNKLADKKYVASYNSTDKKVILTAKEGGKVDADPTVSGDIKASTAAVLSKLLKSVSRKIKRRGCLKVP